MTNVKVCPNCAWTVHPGNYGYNSAHCPSCGSGPLVAKPAAVPTTQKAKGVFGLSSGEFRLYSTGAQALLVLKLIPVTGEWEHDLDWPYKNKVFARPCPPNPEHGFVESREVKSWEDVEALREETAKVCPEAEIILTPLIKADWNAIWTPALLTVGPGHDGATAGKDTINIPLAGMNSLTDKFVHETCGVKKGKGPYIEAVGNKNEITLTQLRGGPILDPGLPLDNIPFNLTVTEVIKTNGEDLLTWATRTKEMEGQVGPVVWHPGGSPTDHYSVHCREKGIPICITFEPHVGQTLTKSKIQVDPLDPLEMCLGLAAVDRVPMEYDKNQGSYTVGSMARSYTTLLLLAAHNSGVLRGPHSYWLGVALGAMVKLGSAALRGEARHAHGLNKDRGEMHEKYLAKSLSFHRAGLSRVTQILTYGFGDVNTSKSFGGKKWGLCGAALVPVFNAIRDLFLNPTEESASNAVVALNIAINQAHNGGWWLNKFVQVSAYDEIPNGNPAWILQAIPAILEASSRRAIAEDHVAKLDAQVTNWPVTAIKPLAWRKVTLDVGLNAFVLNLKAATVPTPQQIVIPVNSTLMTKLIKSAQGEIKIAPGRVDVIATGGEHLNVWSDVELVASARDVKAR